LVVFFRPSASRTGTRSTVLSSLRAGDLDDDDDADDTKDNTES
jgi:hypothetical protein